MFMLRYMRLFPLVIALLARLKTRSLSIQTLIAMDEGRMYPNVNGNHNGQQPSGAGLQEDVY